MSRQDAPASPDQRHVSWVTLMARDAQKLVVTPRMGPLMRAFAALRTNLEERAIQKHYRAAIARLESLSPHLLEDIGVSRSDSAATGDTGGDVVAPAPWAAVLAIPPLAANLPTGSEAEPNPS